jgi:hypothetical protein
MLSDSHSEIPGRNRPVSDRGEIGGIVPRNCSRVEWAG